MRRRIAASLALVLLPVPLLAQQAGVTLLPDSAVARIDQAFAFAAGDAPGCAVGLARAGRPVLTRAYGKANLEYDVPNGPGTIFESGSVAKQFTAAALVLLAQDGRLTLEDDVRKWLPEVPDFGHTITIRHLLTHTSGLRDQWGLLSLQGNPPGAQVHTLATILDLVAHQKALNFAPGSEYLYSNTGYALAAVIVQRASGRSLAQFSQERLFAPLGMTHTRWRDDFARIVKDRATAYEGAPRVGFRQDMPFTNVYGNGGLLTTVGDLLSWNAFLDAPDAQAGGRALVDALETRFRLTSGRTIDYALGLGVGTDRGRRAVTHSGSTAGYRTFLGRYPDDSVSVAVLCNGAGIDAVALAGQVLDRSGLLPPRRAAAAQAGAATPPAPALAAAQLARYAGTYFSARTGGVLRTVLRDGSLATALPVASALTAVSPGRFRLAGQGGGELVFVEGSGEVLRVVGDDSTRYVAMPEAPSTPQALAALAGSYWSSEIDTRLTVVARGDTLVVRRRPADEIALRPAFRDGFTAPGLGTVVFRRDATGQVTGLAIWAGRVRDVRFERER